MTSRIMPPSRSNSRKSAIGSSIPSPPHSPKLAPDQGVRYLGSRERLSKLPAPIRQRSSQSLRSSDHSSRSSSSLSNYRSESGNKSRIPVLSPSANGSSQPSPTKRGSFAMMPAHHSPPPATGSGSTSDEAAPRTRPSQTADATSKIPRSTLLGRGALFSKPRRTTSLSRKLSSKEETPPRSLGAVLDESAVDEEFSEEEYMGEHELPMSPSASVPPDRIQSLMRKKVAQYSTKEGVHSGISRNDVTSIFRHIVDELDDGDAEKSWEQELGKHLNELDDDEYLDYNSLLKLYSQFVLGREVRETDALNRRLFSPVNAYDEEERQYYATKRRRDSDRRFSNDNPRFRSTSQGYSPQAGRVDELSNKLMKTQIDLDRKVSEYESLYEDHNDLKDRLASLEAERDGDIEELKKEKRDLEKRIKGLEDDMKRFHKEEEDAIKTLERNIEESHKEVRNLERTVKLRDDKIQLLEYEVTESARALDASNQNYTLLKDLRDQLGVAEEQCSSLKEQYEAKEKTLKTLLDERDDERREREQVERERDDWEKKCQVLEQRLHAIQQEEDPKKLTALPAMGTGIDKTVTAKEAVEILKERQKEVEEDIKHGNGQLPEDELEDERLHLEELRRILARKGSMLDALEGEKFVAEMRAQDAINALRKFQADMENLKSLSQQERDGLLKQQAEMEDILRSTYATVDTAEQQKLRAEQKAGEAIKELMNTQLKAKLKEEEMTEEHKRNLLRQREEMEAVIAQMDANLRAANIEPTPKTVADAYPDLRPFEPYSIIRIIQTPFLVLYKLHHTTGIWRALQDSKTHAMVRETLFHLFYVLLMAFFSFAAVYYGIKNYQEATLWGEQNGIWIRQKLWTSRCLRQYNGYGGGYYVPQTRFWQGRAYDGFRQWVETTLGVPRLMPS